jgi:hypothetical protein
MHKSSFYIHFKSSEKEIITSISTIWIIVFKNNLSIIFFTLLNSSMLHLYLFYSIFIPTFIIFNINTIFIFHLFLESLIILFMNLFFICIRVILILLLIGKILFVTFFIFVNSIKEFIIVVLKTFY